MDTNTHQFALDQSGPQQQIGNDLGQLSASPPPFQLTASQAKGPIQRKLQFTGEEENVKQAIDLLNKHLFWHDAVLGEDGFVTLEPNGIQGPPTPRQQALYDHLKTIIDNPATTSVKVDSGNSSVIAGSYKLSTIDMQDLLAYGDDGGKSDIGTMAHELVEQYYKQVHSTGYGGESHGAHHEGINAENDVNGYTRGPQRMISASENEDGTLDAVVELDFTHPEGNVVTSRISIKGNNVISNVNKEKK